MRNKIRILIVGVVVGIIVSISSYARCEDAGLECELHELREILTTSKHVNALCKIFRKEIKENKEIKDKSKIDPAFKFYVAKIALLKSVDPRFKKWAEAYQKETEELVAEVVSEKIDVERFKTVFNKVSRVSTYDVSGGHSYGARLGGENDFIEYQRYSTVFELEEAKIVWREVFELLEEFCYLEDREL